MSWKRGAFVSWAVGLSAGCWHTSPPAASTTPQPPPAASPLPPPALPAAEPAPAVDAADEDDASTRPGRIVVSEGGCGTMYPIVFFEHNRAVIPPQSRQILDDIASGVRCDTDAPGGLTFEFPVAGYADPGESEPKVLSLARAKAVARELVARGVPAGVLLISGKGATKPSRDENGRRYNRRVDITRIIYGSD